MTQLVLIRHGQSQWNLENRFTGWVDVDLSERGIKEAREAGRTLKEEGFVFDVACVSLLKRAVRTLWLVMDEMDQMYLPVLPDWRLNERHYGGLQGLNKKETTEKYGPEQVLKWRRGYAVLPPEQDSSDPLHPSHDQRYSHLPEVPSTESLATTVARVEPWWHEVMVPMLEAGKKPIVAAHGNSLRALVKYLDGISDEEIVELNIPTGMPLLYEFDSNLKATGSRYLADAETIAALEAEVANQTATH